MSILEIIKPDDWHVHFREGDFIKSLVPETSKLYNRVIVMPNLSNPITSIAQIKKYKKEILNNSVNKNFEPLMTFYLTESLDVNELIKAFKNNLVFAVKLYPSGATTNSARSKKFQKYFSCFRKNVRKKYTFVNTWRG